jgi:hypothetical protein
MATRRPPTPCVRFLPGHTIHWIHARKSAEDPGPLVVVLITHVESNGRVTLVGDDGEFHLWNHDPLALADAVSHDAHYRPRWHVLSTNVGTFNMSRDDPGPCTEPPPTNG